jgi:hypothetical protein
MSPLLWGGGTRLMHLVWLKMVRSQPLSIYRAFSDTNQMLEWLAFFTTVSYHWNEHTLVCT